MTKTDAPNAMNNLNFVVTNLRYANEEIRQDLESTRESNLGLRIKQRHLKDDIQSLTNRAESSEAVIEELKGKLEEIQKTNDLYSRRMQSMVWQLAQLEGKEVDQEYLSEVYEMWQDNIEAKKRRENQEKVRTAVREQQGREADIPESVAEIDKTLDSSEKALGNPKSLEPKDPIPDIEVVAEPESIKENTDRSSDKKIKHKKHKHNKGK